MSHKHEHCKNAALAASPLGTVSICPACGVVHLSLQYVSMRFEPEAFRALTHMLAMAQARIDQLPPLHHASNEQFEPAGTDGHRHFKMH
ncbi:MAG: hypothetical protein HYS18_12445 [Burkholderiales bacterium]|nr:hypothetical protein [Burkholderiales bacterium]